jgi:hypothetical protein
MLLTFLQAPIPLTKSFIKQADGTIAKSSYPNAYEVTTISETAKDMNAFAALLIKHAAAGHCLLKGNPTRALVCESRAGTTDSSAVTDWIVLDIDGVDNVSTVDDFLTAVGLIDVSYVVQWSASYGIENKKLRAHVFMQLTRPLAAPLIKQWLIQLNHDTPLLKNAMTLTKTGHALSWPLDITACQNDKLLYIAPPLLKGIKDPLKGNRITYVKKINDALSIAGTINSTQQNRELNHKRIAELRAVDGLPPRKQTYKMHGNTEVMVRPDTCVVTDMKVERGFVYFNINGGDSWGYFHPEDNPDYIYNFKGEPAYVTKELLPDYWAQLTSQAVRVSSQGVTYLAFCDRRTGAYWRGTHDAQSDTLDIYVAKNETQVRHFAKQHGLPLGDFIPEWDLVFDPNDNVRVDTANRSVNMFQPTVYMQAPAKKQPTCPKTIYRVIHHALGGDAAITAHFINWVGFILQYRDRTKTAWVLHGTQGTGKGILMNLILRPLFGEMQTAARRMEEFNEQYNDFMEKCFIVFVDEMQAKAMNNERGVMAKLFNFITEAKVTIRMMHKNAYEIRNYTNWIFASNKSDPVAIDREDRRFNVGIYQPNKLIISQQDIEKTIPGELQAFHDYLMQLQIDVKQAGTPIDSVDRNNMISISESSIDTVGSALLGGNFEFFIDLLPTTDAYKTNAMEMNKAENYRSVLKDVMARTKEDGVCNISRDELRTVFDYAVGNIPASPNKFTSLLKHHRIHWTKVWIDSKAVYGMRIEWKDIKHWPAYETTITPPAVTPKQKLKAVK